MLLLNLFSFLFFNHLIINTPCTLGGDSTIVVKDSCEGEFDTLETSKYYLVKMPSNHTEGTYDFNIYRRYANNFTIISPNRSLPVALFEQVYDIIPTWKSPTNSLLTEKKAFCRIIERDDHQFQNFCAEKQINYEQIFSNLYIVEADNSDALNALLVENFVTYLAFESDIFQLEATVTDHDLSVNQINIVQHQTPALTGRNSVLSIKEPFYNTEDLDIWDKHIANPLSASIVSDHTTTMATICCGYGNSSILGKGVVPDISITSSDVVNLFPDDIDILKDLNIIIQNHSYGTRLENFYGVLAHAYDAQVYSDPTILHVFSAGNAGLSSDSIGLYANIKGAATLTGNFKQAKNILTIGAVDAENKVTMFSSNGPAYDGRIKPELMAYSNTGTSNAAALVSGVAALLQQSYLQEEGVNPAAATIKAILIAGANDLNTKGPDFRSGFGSINAQKSLEIIKDNRYFLGELSDSAKEQFIIRVPSSTATLKVVLAWTDPPAIENSSQALINDLDLKIITPDSLIVFPWTLDPSPEGNILDRAAARGEDHLNTIEQLAVEFPTAGNYAIEVSANNLNGIQEFALAFVIEASDTFEWTYPTASDNYSIDGQRRGVFRWQASFKSPTGKLMFRNIHDQEWIELQDSIDLSTGYYTYDYDASKAGLYQANMQINGNSYMSDTFVVSPRISLDLAYNCSSEALLVWSKVENVSSYQIMEWSGGQFDLIDQVLDTFYIIPALESDHIYYKIVPEFEPNKVGVGSIARAFFPESAGCYINSFFSVLNEKEKVEISLILGTSIGVDRIEFYREEDTGDVLIGQFDTNLKNENLIVDESPKEGKNRYYALLYLKNGNIISSQKTTIFFFNQTNALLFPNPIFQDGGINIFMRPFDGIVQFQLIGASGQILHVQDLLSDRDFVDLSTVGITQGTYYYRLKAATWEDRGTLVMH